MSLIYQQAFISTEHWGYTVMSPVRGYPQHPTAEPTDGQENHRSQWLQHRCAQGADEWQDQIVSQQIFFQDNADSKLERVGRTSDRETAPLELGMGVKVTRPERQADTTGEERGPGKAKLADVAVRLGQVEGKR